MRRDGVAAAAEFSRHFARSEPVRQKIHDDLLRSGERYLLVVSVRLHVIGSTNAEGKKRGVVSDWHRLCHCRAKKKLCASACLLTANTPPDVLFDYAHRSVLFEYAEEVVRKGDDIALLGNEQLVLLAQRHRNMRYKPRGALLSFVHAGRATHGLRLYGRAESRPGDRQERALL